MELGKCLGGPLALKLDLMSCVCLYTLARLPHFTQSALVCGLT